MAGACIIQPDFAKTGGLLEGRKVADLAELYFVPVAPHGVATPLNTMAYAHVCATIPNLLVLEWTHYLDKNWTSLTRDVPLTDGYIEVTDVPGIGVELNEDAVKERLDDGFKPMPTSPSQLSCALTSPIPPCPIRLNN